MASGMVPTPRRPAARDPPRREKGRAMHPRMLHWAREPKAHRGHCGEYHGNPFGPGRAWHYFHHPSDQLGGGGFGVRRPLRFLAWKLELKESQISELAGILDELKTERAQAAVDDRRALSALADSVAGESFEAAKAEEAHRRRVQSTE